MAGTATLGLLLSWWLDQMRDLVPARWQTRRRALPDAVVIDCEERAGRVAAAVLSRRRRGRETRLARVDLDAPRLPGGLDRSVLVLRSGAGVLHRVVTLPAEAERDAAQVVRYDMDRLTPFEAGEVFWTCRTARRDAARGRVQLDLFVVPRARLRPTLDALARAGLAPARLLAAAPDGSLVELPLTEPGAARPRLRPAVAWAAGLAAVALLLALPFALQASESAALDEQITNLRPQAARVETMRRRLAARAVPAEAIATERRRTGEMLQTIAALTDLLPDTTYLTELTLRAHRLTVTGRSENAARLVPLLSAGPVFDDAAFTAPVTREPGADRDSFALQATVRP